MQINRPFTDLLRRLPVVAVALLSLLSLTTLAQQPTPPATVRVVTRDEFDKPIAGVEVQFKKTGEAVSAAKTNEQGEAALKNLAPGAYEIVVSKEGFVTLAQNKITVTAGSSTEVR